MTYSGLRGTNLLSPCFQKCIPPIRESGSGTDLEKQPSAPLPAEPPCFLITHKVSKLPVRRNRIHGTGTATGRRLAATSPDFTGMEFLSNTTRWQWIFFWKKFLIMHFYFWNKCPNCYPLKRQILINFNCKLTCKFIFLIYSKMTMIQINSLYKFRNPPLVSSCFFVLFHRLLKIALILLGNTAWANSYRNNKVLLFTSGLHKMSRTVVYPNSKIYFISCLGPSVTKCFSFIIIAWYWELFQWWEGQPWPQHRKPHHCLWLWTTAEAEVSSLPESLWRGKISPFTLI